MIMKTSNIHFSQKYFCHEKKSHTPSYKSLINMNKCIRINLKYHHHDFFLYGNTIRKRVYLKSNLSLFSLSGEK